MTADVDYREGDLPEPDDMLELYASVGWTGYTDHPGKMAAMLPGSSWFQTARADGRLVGLVRVVSDDCSVALVQDLLVMPSYQRLGIGKHLLRSAMARYAGIRQLLLITDDEPATRAFYTRCGLRTLAETHGLGFIRYNLGA